MWGSFTNARGTRKTAYWLQAIARVNRLSGPAKDKGFIVDYVGVGHHLKKALDTYDEREQSALVKSPNNFTYSNRRSSS
jgi:type I site-specific restriction-modification system R (restriction) subunit